MPTPIESFIGTPAKPRIQFGVAPVQNAIHSLLLLTETDRLSGLSNWVKDTANQLTPKEREKHYYVMIGFYFAITTKKDWSSFPAYLDHLSTVAPEVLRDKILQSYRKIAMLGQPEDPISIETALSSEENYLSFLRQRFLPEKINENVERWAYQYIVDPPALQELIVSHLTEYWEKYLEVEWERVLPTLQKAVDAFSKLDLHEMDNCEAASFVLGQPLSDDFWLDKCKKADRIFFAPSLHVGPYLGGFGMEEYTGIIFGARLPESSSDFSPELSLADIYVRLNALADETRLQILKHIATEGEACSTEIIDALDLSQSAASRHLTQLTAIGFLTSRRIDSAKCYRLDQDRIANAFDTIKGFLGI